MNNDFGADRESESETVYNNVKAVVEEHLDGDPTGPDVHWRELAKGIRTAHVIHEMHSAPDASSDPK